jgi:hypothetical protein
MYVTITIAGSVPPFDTRAGGNYEATCCHYVFSNIIPPIEFGGFPTAAVLNDYYAIICSVKNVKEFEAEFRNLSRHIYF